MSTVPATTSNPSTTTDNTNKTKSQTDLDTLTGNREDFLNILIAQLKHQDPLNPMKGTEFIDSITRLSAVEQTINQNTHLENIEKLLGGGSTQQLGSPVSYLDRNITFTSDSIELKNGASTFSYDLEKIPKQLFISVRDSKGQTVFSGSAGENATNSLGNLKLGTNSVSWDGTDNAGNKVADGVYKIEVSYLQDSGASVEVPVTTTGVVTGANFEDGSVALVVVKLKTTLEKITSINSSGQVSQN